MNHHPQNEWILRQKLIGPLVKYLNPFTDYLIQQGFCWRYIGLQCRVTANFSNWLFKKNVLVCKINETHIDEFLNGRNYTYAVSSGEVSTLHRLLNFLKQLKIVKIINKSVSSTPTQKIFNSYRSHILNDKGLSIKTLNQYWPFIEKFLLRCFGNKFIDLSVLNEKDIINFIKHQTANLSVARAKVAVNALRSFLRYAIFCGDINAALINAVPIVAAWSLSSIPKAISQEDIDAVLENCPRETQIGKRDYAILMLLLHLGLRSNEIVELNLDSVNWENGFIAIKGKGDQDHTLPLPIAVGEAIADYLQYGRPKCKDRRLFLRTIAPFAGLGAQQTIATIVKASIERAEIDPPSRGAHQFRHAFATRLMQQGGSLKEIANLLRHQHPKTTNIYAKVDIKSLHSLSMPWPGDIS
jgi:integrase/recombinase XerD